MFAACGGVPGRLHEKFATCPGAGNRDMRPSGQCRHGQYEGVSQICTTRPLWFAERLRHPCHFTGREKKERAQPGGTAARPLASAWVSLSVL
jgi:hypothetical protein